MCGSQDEWPWIKGHRSAWHLVLNTRFFPNKCIRNQIWSCHKVGQGQPRLSHLCKTGRAHIPYATYQVPRPLAFWFQRRHLKGFNHVWARWPSWSCDQYNWYKFWPTYHKESSYEIWVQMAKWFLRKLCFDVLMGLQYERPKLKS